MSYFMFAERYIAENFKQLAQPPEMPEWKKASFGGGRAAYGKKTNLSIVEQRQSLPIYKLRENLVQVMYASHYVDRWHVLVVAWARVPHRKCWHSSDVSPEGRRPEGYVTTIANISCVVTREAQATTNLLPLRIVVYT